MQHGKRIRSNEQASSATADWCEASLKEMLNEPEGQTGVEYRFHREI